MARKIEQSEITLDFLKYFKIALDTLKQRKGKIFVHLGQVSNPDVCVVIADFFMRVNSVLWSIVSGCCMNKLVVVFRNDGIRKNAGKVAKDSFDSMGSAGGHKNMSRAEIPLKELQKQVDPLDDKKVLNWLIKHIEKNTGKK
jgi:nanoRNase/pAp phosphatase (c-di-AMP/oligoRNAs hydrolase)